MKIRRSLISRLGGDRSGVSSVEFALLVPITFLLFFGMLEGSDLLTVNRRIAHASNSLADLVSQEPEITHSQMTDIIVGVSRMMETTDNSTLEVKVVSVIRDPDNPDQAIVHWSRDQDGGEPYSPGSTYTGLDRPDVLNSMASLVVSELDYTYDSGLTSKVFRTPYVFHRDAKRMPRKSTRVQLCNNNPTPTCTS